MAKIFFFVYTYNNITYCENISNLEELTFHLFNISFIFLLIFFFLFDKRLIINFLLFFLKNIKIIFLIVCIFFTKITNCAGIFQYNKNHSNRIKLKKKKLKYSLKKNSFFFNTILNLKNVKKTLVNQKTVKAFGSKNFNLPDYFYKSWWDFLILGKKTFTTPFLLNKEISTQILVITLIAEFAAVIAASFASKIVFS